MHTGKCHALSLSGLLDRLNSLGATREEEFHGNSPPGALAFSFTHILIPYSRVSLVYGTKSSLLIFYYKCLLRLNSDIVKSPNCSKVPEAKELGIPQECRKEVTYSVTN